MLSDKQIFIYRITQNEHAFLRKERFARHTWNSFGALRRALNWRGPGVIFHQETWEFKKQSRDSLHRHLLCLFSSIKLLCRIRNFCGDLSLVFVPICYLSLLGLLSIRFSLFNSFLDLLTFRQLLYIVPELLPSNNFSDDINGSSRTLIRR